MTDPLLRIDDLHVHFPGPRQHLFGPRLPIKAVDGVSLTVQPGEILGLVGESGCGKSTTARAASQLIRPHSGAVWLDQTNLCELSGSALRQARRPMQMVFQDPHTALDPRWTIAASIAEPLVQFSLCPASERAERVAELLTTVGLDPALGQRYPHEFSGGQRQRVGIARALAAQPKILLCDEPVSALDVSVQAQIINVLLELRQRYQLAMVFIAHDLAVVRHIADRVAVMYAGRIVETGQTDDVFRTPRHPYTAALLNAIPIPDPQQARQQSGNTGEPPSPIDAWRGCAYRTRCPHADQHCDQPPAFDGTVRCIHPLADPT